jgi:hypothetical protein
MSRRALYSFAGLLFLVIAALYLVAPGPGLCEKGHRICAGMTREQVLAMLGPSPYPRGDWPTRSECWLGYPERCEHWEDGPYSVTVRFNPETEVVECKEVISRYEPSLLRVLLERIRLVGPRSGHIYAGP